MEVLFGIVTALFLFHNTKASAVDEPSDIFRIILGFPVRQVTGCSNVVITDKKGMITSPNYPKPYPSHVSCSWHIQGQIGDYITILPDDIDIEESGDCMEHPCCIYNWLKIESMTSAQEMQLCGHNVNNSNLILTSSHKVTIKFHISMHVKGGRGFRLYYLVGTKTGQPPHCKSPLVLCGDNKCIPSSTRCNGVADCSDGSDEHFCSSYCPSQKACKTVFQCYDASQHCNGIIDCPDLSDEMECESCAPNTTHCGLDTLQCYNPKTQRCNRILDCANGEDEKDCVRLCPEKIMCASGLGCYTMKDRCNGIAQCGDSSDEKDCGPNMCNYENGGFLCNNGRCIREAWKCDRTNDCGDGSDESNCLRNSVLTAAITGSLICALLLVVAISCTCRLHALRSLESRLSMRETPLSRLSQEFFFREPPPSYAIAVGDYQQNLCPENNHHRAPTSRRYHHRSRRHRRHANSTTVQTRPERSTLLQSDGQLSSSSPEHQPPSPNAQSSTSSEVNTRVTNKPDVAPVNANINFPVYGNCKDSSSDDDDGGPPTIGQNIESSNPTELGSSGQTQSNTESNSYCESDTEPLVA